MKKSLFASIVLILSLVVLISGCGGNGSHTRKYIKSNLRTEFWYGVADSIKEYGVNGTSSYTDDAYPLQLAIGADIGSQRRLGLVKALLKDKADVNAWVTGYSQPLGVAVKAPILMAIEADEPGIVKLLLEHDAWPIAVATDTGNVMYNVVEKVLFTCQPEILKVILKEYGDEPGLTNYRDKNVLRVDYTKALDSDKYAKEYIELFNIITESKILLSVNDLSTLTTLLYFGNMNGGAAKLTVYPALAKASTNLLAKQLGTSGFSKILFEALEGPINNTYDELIQFIEQNTAAISGESEEMATVLENYEKRKAYIKEEEKAALARMNAFLDSTMGASEASGGPGSRVEE